MADLKISQLPAATTPLAGTEVIPIVQSGVTDKVTVANLTANRAVSATQYTSTIATGTAPLVVASTTEVANLKAATATLADSATSATSANAVKSNATTGLLQVTGPAAASTRVMTTPDANFTVARTDAGQTFTGNQYVTGFLQAGAINTATGITTVSSGTPTTIYTISTAGLYLVHAYIASYSAGPSQWSTFAYVSYTGTGNAYCWNQGANVNLTVGASGLNVTLTQSAGTFNFTWAIVKIG